MSFAYALVALQIAGTLTSASASLPTSCINITLSNILNIGDCLGSATNFCGNTNPLAALQGITKITGCVIQGIYKNGSPQGILSAFAPLLSLIPNSNIASTLNLGALGNLQVFRNDSCTGSINIGLPVIGNLGSVNMVQSTVQTIVCILKQFPADQLSTFLPAIICPLITVFNQAIQGDFFLQLTLRPFISTIVKALGVQCPSLPGLQLPGLQLPGLSLPGLSQPGLSLPGLPIIG